MPPLTRHKSIEGKIQAQHLTPGSNEFKKTKDDLLQQSAQLSSIVDTQKDQERKAREAAEYRRSILKAKERENMEMSSPSIGREKAAIKRSKDKKLKAEESKLDHHEKATFWQCVFNLANILMVRFEMDLRCNHGFPMPSYQNYSLIVSVRVLACWDSRMRSRKQGL